MFYFYHLLIVLYFIVLVLPGIGYPIAIFPQGDEIMHIRSIRETIADGKWILPELTGLPNPYKPPMLFWLGIAADKLLTISFFSERFVSILFGLGSVLLVFQIVRAYGRSHFYSFLIALTYAASFGAWKFSRLLMMEQGMTFFVLFFLSLYLVYDKKRKIKYLLAGSIVLGLGYFLKGPIIIIYGIIIIISFFFVDVVRIRRKTFFISFKYITKYLTHSILILSLFLPLVWLFYLYFFEESGKQLIHFFFVNENAGKFHSENQSAFRIIGGWLLYSFPYTLILIFSLLIQLRTRVSSKRTRVSRALLLSLFFLTIFHLLPNRKDTYYIVAFLPILFITVGISHTPDIFKSIFIRKSNLVFIILFFLLCILFAYTNHQILALATFLFFALITFLSILNGNKFFWATYIISILIIPAFAYLIIFPNLDPLIANDIREYKINEYCVISENPWHGMEIQNQSPDSSILYSPPSTGKYMCEDKKLPILSISSFYIPGGNYKATKQWLIWKSHLNLDYTDLLEIINNSGLLKFKTTIKLYEVDQI